MRQECLKTSQIFQLKASDFPTDASCKTFEERILHCPLRYAPARDKSKLLIEFKNFLPILFFHQVETFEGWEGSQLLQTSIFLFYSTVPCFQRNNMVSQQADVKHDNWLNSRVERKVNNELVLQIGTEVMNNGGGF